MIGADQSSDLIIQLRKRGIRDTRVLKAIETVPRELFVAPAFTSSAYLDLALPIGCGQTISQPFVVAYMTERLEVSPNHDVLEVGTGSGYQAAILAQLCRHVFTIERHETLHREADARLRRLGISNVTLVHGNGAYGWPTDRLFDRIIITAAAPETPVALLRQLQEGGRLIVPIGKRPENQRLVLFKKAPGSVIKEDLLAVRFVPLVEDE